uniref:Uncharacterized protein n=1 Tax=Caenorhabditis japonica TaxID=281687 RepID=A0A8R1HT91_CAEJA
MISSRKLLLVLSLIFLFADRCSSLASRIATDCDVEFAEIATKLASEHISDPTVVQYIHAVMSSCNKAPIQKMAETSVFLLEKGTITPRVMSQIRETFEKIQKRKDVELSKKMSQLPPELYSTGQKIRTISTSGGLSGNERIQHIEVALGAVPSSYRHQILQALEESPPKLDGAIEVSTVSVAFTVPRQSKIQEIEEEKEREREAHLQHFLAQERQELEKQEKAQQKEVVPNVAFPKNPVTEPRVNMPFQPPEKHVIIHPQSISGARQNVLFPDLPPTRPIEPIVKKNAAGLRSLLENPNFDSIISSIVQKGAKIAKGPLPQSVGSVDHSKVSANSNTDLSLLSPAMWQNAAKLLSQSSNDLPTALSKFIEKGSQGLPQVLVPSGQNQIRQAPPKDFQTPFLPTRRQNDGALDKYDTHVDRFATSGPANRIQINGDLAQLRLPPGASNTAIQPTKVETIVGGMPTMPPSAGYATYAPAPTAIVPKVVERILSPEEITGSYRRERDGLGTEEQWR